MNPLAMATRLSVLAKALPLRVLLVDDDELEQELLADRLRGAGFEVACANNGEHALALLQDRWYPLTITDWQMPVMDGLSFTEALRSTDADTYVIMLTMHGANVDYERGYLAGVDDYLTKKTPDAELFARIHAAFNTLALRRTLKDTQALLESSTRVDDASGALAPKESHRRLHSEIRRAQRYHRELSVIVVSARDDHGNTPANAVLKDLIQTLERGLRTDVDWIGRLEESGGAEFVVVLPEAAAADLPGIRDRVLAALAHYRAPDETRIALKSGCASIGSLIASGTQPEVASMLRAAAVMPDG
jgi:two-component system, cell cycle response regulator